MRPRKSVLMSGLCMLLAGCTEADDQTIDYAEKIPSSKRSREAIKRVSPALIGDLKGREMEFGAPVFIRIFKQERHLEVWMKKKERFELFRTYKVAAMSGKPGPKLKEGDLQAPEGFYTIGPSQMNPNSQFHLSFNLGYPNAYDRAHQRTGSALMVHGNQLSTGCFAMTDHKVEEIYTLCDAALRNGQTSFQVHCFPFRMTEANMEKHGSPLWNDFWKNLKTGYDWFKKHGVPPTVQVRSKRYVFK